MALFGREQSGSQWSAFKKDGADWNHIRMDSLTPTRVYCKSMSNHVSFYPIPEFTRPPTSWDDRKHSSFETILFFTAEPEPRGPEDPKARPGFGIADDVMADLAWSCPSGYVHS